jgi:hypothetical protein
MSTTALPYVQRFRVTRRGVLRQERRCRMLGYSGQVWNICFRE